MYLVKKRALVRETTGTAGVQKKKNAGYTNPYS